MFRSLFILVWFAFLAGWLPAADLPGRRRVMTWVPPYGVAECRKRLEESFEGKGMKDGLTHLGLQFWSPTREGGLKLVDRFGAIDEATVTWFVEWGKRHGVRVLLCVYNGSANGWDWELAQSAFDTNREKFVRNLLGETRRLKLDGVDLDLEGNGELDGSRPDFLRFVRELSAGLHGVSKELTVDTFPAKWHAPNRLWWSDLFPHVDAVHAMGYDELGASAPDWRSYAFLKKAAGRHSSKLVIGMPGHLSEWQGERVQAHLDWVASDKEVGLAIWDARLTDPAWRSGNLWKTLEGIRTGERE